MHNTRNLARKLIALIFELIIKYQHRNHIVCTVGYRHNCIELFKFSLHSGGNK